jgi:hypothetical protein
MTTLDFGMVRITIERMDEPRDRMLGQLEVPAFVEMGELTGEVQSCFAIAFGAHIILPIDEREIDRFFAAQRAEV